jgi:nitrate/nitrite transport system substrate-binding protein
MSRTLDLPDFHIFQRNAANFPWRSHADWFLAQMVRWKQAPADTDIKAVADRVYRTDIYRAAAREMNVACPEVDRLPPGGHGEPLLPSPDDRSSTETKAGVACGSN